MWNTKSSPSEPKKKKLVKRRHASPRRKMRLVLKYTLKGVMIWTVVIGWLMMVGGGE